jgi:hypothetical protein
VSATPAFEQFAHFLDRQAPWPWLALQPWLLVAQMVQASWQPWLAASSALLTAASPPTSAAERQHRS